MAASIINNNVNGNVIMKIINNGINNNVMAIASISKAMA
jgi:hypothetical protein